MFWAVFTRRFINTPWKLLFVLPPTLSQAEVQRCILFTDQVNDDGYRHMYLLKKMAEDEIETKIQEEQRLYRG